MSKGHTPLDHHTVCNEPHIIGTDGMILSRTAFAKRCYVASASTMRELMEKGQRVKARKFMVLFGANGPLWKYKFVFYCTGAKKEAIQRAYDAVKLHSTGQAVVFSRFGMIESYDFDYNEKAGLFIG